VTRERIRVAVLYGGISAEHEVSVTSARGVLTALDPERYEVVPIGIARDGTWLLPTRSPGQLSSAHGTLPPVDPSDGASGTLERREGRAQLVGGAPIDVCFPVLHGTGGEDGTIQGFLETLGVAYVGSGVTASANAMAKHVAKVILADAGIPVVPWLTVTARQLDASHDDVVARCEERCGAYPVFVKPDAQGSSVGVHKVRDADQLVKALSDAIRYGGLALIEEAIEGREIECAILGSDDPRASVLGEITPCNEFYDYEAKYLADGSVLTIPAVLEPAMTERIRDLAVRAFTALGCDGLARVDFFVRGDEVFCNELNTMPGFTPISMYPKLWEASGVAYPELLDRLIALALERHRRRDS
jgi:D-alanine-D-alanine ligase